MHDQRDAVREKIALLLGTRCGQMFCLLVILGVNFAPHFYVRSSHRHNVQ